MSMRSVNSQHVLSRIGDISGLSNVSEHGLTPAAFSNTQGKLLKWGIKLWLSVWQAKAVATLLPHQPLSTCTPVTVNKIFKQSDYSLSMHAVLMSKDNSKNSSKYSNNITTEMDRHKKHVGSEPRHDEHTTTRLLHRPTSTTTQTIVTKIFK